jgi:hypothetical protein
MTKEMQNYESKENKAIIAGSELNKWGKFKQLRV